MTRESLIGLIIAIIISVVIAGIIYLIRKFQIDTENITDSLMFFIAGLVFGYPSIQVASHTVKSRSSILTESISWLAIILFFVVSIYCFYNSYQILKDGKKQGEKKW